MEQPGPARCPFSAKTASFQVGELVTLGRWPASLSLGFFLLCNGCKYPSGGQGLSNGIIPLFAGLRRDLVICGLVLKVWGSRGQPPPHGSQAPPLTQLEAPEKPPPSVVVGKPGGGVSRAELVPGMGSGRGHLRGPPTCRII